MQRLVLLGNGVHADSMGAFVLYVISSLVHISQLSQMAQGDLMAQVRLCDTVLEISDDSDEEDHCSPAEAGRLEGGRGHRDERSHQGREPGDCGAPWHSCAANQVTAAPHGTPVLQAR